ncbi:hypothetical protein LguiB_032052 [Lonicera macranthoides]
MAVSMKFVVLMMYIFTVSSPIKSEPSVCGVDESITFLHDLRFQCPKAISLSFPLQMDGESIDRVLSSNQANVNTVVLFYASWCPFSSEVRSQFAVLSSMFPQIKHLMVEQSSAFPSIFSRYGIHSVPSILMVNRSGRVRYHGPKDLSSFVDFYKRTTGLDPEVDLTENQLGYSKTDDQRISQPWNKATSMKELFIKEPYLLLSVMFLFLKACLYSFPGIISQLMALWFAYIPHLNLEIFGESRQLLGRALHMIDVKRVWSKLKLCKSRNFHKGAFSARVWASSLASVSLGERRASPSGDL